jgi:small subunit ribosomal protein S3
MEAGAIGIQIRIGGKLGGEKARFQKFKEGYIKHSGYYSETLVDKGYARAMLKPGIVGIQVKILKEVPKEVLEFKVEKSESEGNKKDEV